ncbi:MAG TPA: hypothetical protein VFD58_00230 [Blastocatellia bacterium]|nr:hypothetical protein [Blastocatellia bacterium]
MSSAPKLLILSGLLCAAVTAAAQQPGAPPPPPRPMPDYSPQAWKEYQSDAGKFSVRLPGQPKEMTTVREGAGGKVTINTWYYDRASFVSYNASWWDAPQGVGDVKVMLGHLRDQALERVAKDNHRVLKDEEITVDGRPGRFLVLDLNGKAFVRMRWAIVDNRIYLLTVQTLNHGPDAMMSENGYEKIAMSFLDSFKLMK